MRIMLLYVTMSTCLSSAYAPLFTYSSDVIYMYHIRRMTMMRTAMPPLHLAKPAPTPPKPPPTARKMMVIAMIKVGKE